MGGTVISGGTTNIVTIQWTSVGAASVSVNYSNTAGCYALLPKTLAVTVHPLPTPTIAQTPPLLSGTNVCINGTYTYTTEPGKTNYVWSVSPGGTMTGGGTFLDDFVTVVWNVLGPQSVSVNYNNSFNCAAHDITIFPVVVTPLPVPTITGSSTGCLNSTGNIYSTETGMTGYLWTISAGGTITAGAGTSSITVTWTVVGSQTLTVNYTNGSGCTAVVPTSKIVTVNPLPAPTITGPNTVCVVSAGNVYTTETGMFGYLWTVSAGGAIISGGGTNSINVTWNSAGAQTVTVTYTNINSCSPLTPTSYAVTAYPTFVVGSISADQTINTGGIPAQLIGVAPTGGNTPYTYQWQSSTDGSTFANNGLPTTLNYQPPALTQTTWYQLIQTSSGPCGSVITNNVKITVKYRVSGILTYDDQPAHTPLSGFTVYLKTTPGNVTVGTAVTNGSGYYEIFTETGNYKLSAAPPPGAIYYADINDAIAIFDYTNGDMTILNDPLRVKAGDVADPLDGIPDIDDYIAVFWFQNGDPSYYSPSTPDWIFENPYATVTNSSITKNFMGLHSGNVTGSYPNP